MLQSVEDAVAAVAQRRMEALPAGDAARREFSFDLCRIADNDIRVPGETAIVAGRYRNVARVRGYPVPLKRARQLRVYVNRGGHWKPLAHQAAEIAPGAACPQPPPAGNSG